MAAAAGLAALGIIEREGLVRRARQTGAVLGEMLRERLGGHANVADVRGLGLLWGVEFVRDRATLEPFPRREQLTERLWSALFKKGLITYKAVGLAGVDGDALVVVPPFIAEHGDLQFIVETLAEAMVEVMGWGEAGRDPYLRGDKLLTLLPRGRKRFLSLGAPIRDCLVFMRPFLEN